MFLILHPVPCPANLTSPSNRQSYKLSVELGDSFGSKPAGILRASQARARPAPPGGAARPPATWRIVAARWHSGTDARQVDGLGLWRPNTAGLRGFVGGPITGGGGPRVCWGVSWPPEKSRRFLGGGWWSACSLQLFVVGDYILDSGVALNIRDVFGVQPTQAVYYVWLGRAFGVDGAGGVPAMVVLDPRQVVSRLIGGISNTRIPQSRQ